MTKALASNQFLLWRIPKPHAFLCAALNFLFTLVPSVAFEYAPVIDLTRFPKSIVRTFLLSFTGSTQYTHEHTSYTRKWPTGLSNHDVTEDVCLWYYFLRFYNAIWRLESGWMWLTWSRDKTKSTYENEITQILLGIIIMQSNQTNEKFLWFRAHLHAKLLWDRGKCATWTTFQCVPYDEMLPMYDFRVFIPGIFDRIEVNWDPFCTYEVLCNMPLNYHPNKNGNAKPVNWTALQNNHLHVYYIVRPRTSQLPSKQEMFMIFNLARPESCLQMNIN